MRGFAIPLLFALAVCMCCAEEEEAAPKETSAREQLLDTMANYVRTVQQKRAMANPEKKVFHCKHENEGCLVTACCHELVCDRGRNSRMSAGTCRTGCLYGRQTCWKDSQCCSGNCKGIFKRYCVWT